MGEWKECVAPDALLVEEGLDALGHRLIVGYKQCFHIFLFFFYAGLTILFIALGNGSHLLLILALCTSLAACLCLFATAHKYIV